MVPMFQRSVRAHHHRPYVFELSFDQCQLIWCEGPDEPEHVHILPVGELLSWLLLGDVDYATGYAKTQWREEDGRPRGEHTAYLVLYGLPEATMYRLRFT